MTAAVPSQCGSTAFNQWCHCLCNAACLWNAAALHPNTAASPVDCSNSACGRQQLCCWTVTLPSQRGRTAFSWWQQCLHMAAALPSQCGSTAFKQWCHCLCNAACLWNAAALHPSTAALPVDCSLTAFRMWRRCLRTAAVLLLDSDTASVLRQHCLQLVAALPSHGSGSAFTMRQQHCCWTVTLPSQ